MGRETPYGHYLQEWLGTSTEVQVRGVCGELTGEMAMRFRRDVCSSSRAMWSCWGEPMIWDGTHSRLRS